MSAEGWLKNSILAKRAVANGATGTTHSLTIEQQGGFHRQIQYFEEERGAVCAQAEVRGVAE